MKCYQIVQSNTRIQSVCVCVLLRIEHRISLPITQQLSVKGNRIDNDRFTKRCHRRTLMSRTMLITALLPPCTRARGPWSIYGIHPGLVECATPVFVSAHSLTHLLNDSLTQSFSQSLNHSTTQSFPHRLSRLLSPSLTLSLTDTSKRRPSNKQRLFVSLNLACLN